MNTTTKILLADDSKFMRKVIIDILTEAGFSQFVEAENGNEAVAKLQSEKPGLVMLDVIMPELDGIGVLKKMKELGIETKVIIVSAVGQEAMISEAKSLGAEGYVIKPFEKVDVIKEVESALA